MANRISIIVQAEDNASKVIKNVSKNIDDASASADGSSKSISRLSDHVGALSGVTAAAGVATYSLIGAMNDSINSANRLQGSLTGLNSVARAFGQDAGAAEQAAKNLANDGLMTVADAATGLKNLLAAGFSLPEAVKLMNRFKDSAAFGRQSALSFGQAVSSATEGIKNGNSILVDNAGVTKNLSMMLTEAGYSAQDLMKASSDAGVRQAIFNGILKETNAQAGDAARLADSAAGKQAVWAAQTEVLKQEIGTALQPALLALLQTVTPILVAVSDWVSKNPELASGILIAATAVSGLTAMAGSLGLAIIGLAPIFAMFQAAAVSSVGAVSAAFGALKLLVASPLFMPAIAVAAALAAIALVWNEYNKMMDAIEGAKRSQEASNKAGADLRSVADRQFKAGKIDQKEKDRLYNVSYKALGTNYAEGGPTVVGEHGPEIVDMPRGSSVTQAYRTRNILTQGGGDGGINISINGPVSMNSMADIKSLASQIDAAQRFARMGMA